MSSDRVILQVENLAHEFSVAARSLRKGRGDSVQAVAGASFEIHAGETLGLVGESGSGKSTTAKCIVRLLKPSSGHIYFEGQDLAGLRRHEVNALRRRIQIVFQDPYSSLNPRMTVGEIVAEPLRIHHLCKGAALTQRVGELLEVVGLEPSSAHRFPHEFSGGQRQRVGIARALALDPELLILDEPVSALDVSIQAQILNLLEDLKANRGLAYLFISHDLSVIRQVCDRVAVMYLGRIMEIGTVDEVFRRPSHPYTRALLSAIPIAHPRLRGGQDRIVLSGEMPSATKPPSGCRFRTRCWMAQDTCAAEQPELAVRFVEGHPTACHFAADSYSDFRISGEDVVFMRTENSLVGNVHLGADVGSSAERGPASDLDGGPRGRK